MALAQGDGFVEKKTEPASIDKLLAISTFDPPAPTTATETAVASDLSQTTHDVDIPLNRKVLSYIELFQGNLREFISEGLQRGAKYLPMIQEEFREQGLPLDLAYIPLIESAFKNTARSRVKAQGMWQFMSYTGPRARPEAELVRRRAVRSGESDEGRGEVLEDARQDVRQRLASRDGVVQRRPRPRAAGHAPVGQERFLGADGDVEISAARNARIRADDSGGDRHRQEPVRSTVSRSNPEMPLAYEKAQVSDPIDLRLVAEWTNAPIDEIEALNPELRRWTTPVRSPNYEIKVPVGTGDAFRARLAETPAENLNAFQWHSVKRGETLLSISRKLKVKQADLAEANSLTLRSRVQPGQQLIIPRAPTTLLAARPENPAPETVLAESRPVVSEKAMLVATPAPTEPVEPQRIVHRVKRGDTLFSIAKLYNTTVASLKSWNTRTIRGNRINIGDRLTIFTTRAAN